MKFINWNDIQKSFEPFKGVFELQDLIKLCSDISIAAWEACYLLPQCFTEENFEENIVLIEKEWGKHFVDALVVEVREGMLSEVDSLLDSEAFSHVVQNGEFDSHFLKGIKVLKSHFADNKWDLYLDANKDRTDKSVRDY
ncbi:hypothetical protein Pan241w_20540 [Gimesia alba]|uniref:Uncharacterized protein n=1 Tax=Gimesia alba TaxID=2527973 RepID=A0A517RDN8_9PLAN|nr:hypothetical protein [Gimesia alba]QDT41974.1 hypothetical protein Pan241w_20540 [Gimesia alba]